MKPAIGKMTGAPQFVHFAYFAPRRRTPPLHIVKCNCVQHGGDRPTLEVLVRAAPLDRPIGKMKPPQKARKPPQLARLFAPTLPKNEAPCDLGTFPNTRPCPPKGAAPAPLRGDNYLPNICKCVKYTRGWRKGRLAPRLAKQPPPRQTPDDREPVPSIHSLRRKP